MDENRRQSNEEGMKVEGERKREYEGSNGWWTLRFPDVVSDFNEGKVSKAKNGKERKQTWFEIQKIAWKRDAINLTTDTVLG